MVNANLQALLPTPWTAGVRWWRACAGSGAAAMWCGACFSEN